MNYEEKYKAALGWMQSLYKGLHGKTKEEAEHYFPELKESEEEINERIRIGLIKAFNTIGKLKWGGLKVQDVLTWLEKQQGKSALEAWRDMRFEVYQQASGNRHEPNCSDNTTKMFSLNDIDEIIEKISEQKLTDKAEPKFKIGNFITNGYCLGKVIAITNDAYLLDTGQGIPFSCENTRLWTINDAKDGDVLMTTKARNCPFIYRKTDYNNNLAYYYAGVDGDGDFCEGCIKRTLYHFGSVSNVVPATKEQRDLLFQKMKEAGYEWDADNKKLKKIESKTLNADDVIEWIDEHVPTKFEDMENYIQQFKKDFGL